MSIICAVPYCGNTTHLYRFPTNHEYRAKWIKFVNLGPLWKPYARSYVCRIHFARKCFAQEHGVKLLKSNAVPTIISNIEVNILSGKRDAIMGHLRQR